MKNKKAMYALSYGLFVLTAREGERDNGCIINTAMQVTDEPNRIVVAVNKVQFTLSILAEDAPFSIYQRFGFQSGREADKFAGFKSVERGENGILRLTEGANAWLTCRVVSTMDLDSHTLFLADVVDGDVTSAVPSVTYAYYQSHVKPKPQAAPAPAGKKRWVCKVCGYIYEGDVLPADFICPLCKHPASDFEELT